MMAGRLIVLLGGARSGKSRRAVELAAALGDPVVYLAAGQSTDAEMSDRIARHRADRPAGWQTVERDRGLAAAIRATPGARAIIIDSLGDLATTYLIEAEAGRGTLTPADLARVESALDAEVADVIAATRAGSAATIVVSNEVGLGLVPPYPLGRAFRDVLGRANQRIAAAADEVYLLIAGLPIDLRALAARWPAPPDTSG